MKNVKIVVDMEVTDEFYEEEMTQFIIDDLSFMSEEDGILTGSFTFDCDDKTLRFFEKLGGEE
jgi:hypothetical protein